MVRTLPKEADPVVSSTIQAMGDTTRSMEEIPKWVEVSPEKVNPMVGRGFQEFLNRSEMEEKDGGIGK